MKKKYLILFSFFIALCVFHSNVSGQNSYSKMQVKKKNGKWGILGNGNWVIAPDYDRIESKITGAGMLKNEPGYFAWKGDKLDVYFPWRLEAIISNITIDDTSHIASFTELFYQRIIPVYENKLCGWKYYDKLIAPVFDSIRLHFDFQTGNFNINEVYDIRVYKNGKMGLMSRMGKVLLPLGNYSDVRFLGGSALTFRKDDKTGQVLEGHYFNEHSEILPLYTSLEYVTGVILNDVYISYTNREIPGFYRCQLPNGNADYFIQKDSGIIRLPDALAMADRSKRVREETEKKNRAIAEVEKRKWVFGLVLFAKGGAVGIKDATGKVFLPAQATALEFGRFSIDPDGDMINVTMKDKYSDGRIELNWSNKGTFPVTDFMSQYEDISKFVIKAELNPYNSLAGNYKLYFDEVIDAGFDYRSGFSLYQGACPLCEGTGKLKDGVNVYSRNITYDRVVKDGSTTITRKNYLANERVGADGRLYVPTTTQTNDNYKTYKEEKTVVTTTDKYKTCTLCDGKKRFKFGAISWDEARNEYVLKFLNF